MRRKLVLLGGAGHARVILDILGEDEQTEVVGYVSTERDPGTTELFGCPWLGTDDSLHQLAQPDAVQAFVAIGDNEVRRVCFERMRGLGFAVANVISRNASISRRASLGTGVAVMAGAVIHAGATIGDGVIINTNAVVEHDCTVGDFAHVAPGSILAGTVHVGGGALIGVGARVIPNIRIGPRAVVAAGAVVVRNVLDGSLVMGIPARTVTNNE